MQVRYFFFKDYIVLIIIKSTSQTYWQSIWLISSIWCESLQTLPGHRKIMPEWVVYKQNNNRGNLATCPGSSSKMYKKKWRKWLLTYNEEKEKKPQNPNPAMSQASDTHGNQVRWESREQTKDSVNYRETEREMIVWKGKKKKKKVKANRTHFCSSGKLFSPFWTTWLH